MKTILTIILGAFFFSQTALAQSVCRSQLLNYTGPHNTPELTTKLYNSTNPILTGLSTTLKQALILRTAFDNGYPRGIDSTDNDIAALFQSSNGSAVLSAIFNCPVAIYSYATKPAFSTMDVNTFLTLYNSDPAKYAFTPFISVCYNCYFGKSDVCCYVGGPGCYDIAIQFTTLNEQVYVIQE